MCSDNYPTNQNSLINNYDNFDYKIIWVSKKSQEYNNIVNNNKERLLWRLYDTEELHNTLIKEKDNTEKGQFDSKFVLG